MEMKSRRRRGRPKGSKNKKSSSKMIEVDMHMKPKGMLTAEDAAKMQEQIADLQKQLAEVSGLQVRSEESEAKDVDISNLNNVTILTTEKKEKLEREIRRCKAQLSMKESSVANVSGAHGGEGEAYIKNSEIDKRGVLDRMNRAKLAIAHAGACRLSPSTKSKLIAEKLKYEKELHETLPSLSDCNSKDPAVTNEISRYLYKHKKKYAKMMQRLQNINKLLEPEDPNAGTLDYVWKK